MKFSEQSIREHNYYALLTRAHHAINRHSDWDATLVKIASPPLMKLIDQLFFRVVGSDVLQANELIPTDTNEKFVDRLENLGIFTNEEQTEGWAQSFQEGFYSLYACIFNSDCQNYEQYEYQGYISSLLEDQLALLLASDTRFKTWNMTREVVNQTQRLPYFFERFLKYIPERWITDDRSGWVNSDDYLMSQKIFTTAIIDIMELELEWRKEHNKTSFHAVEKAVRSGEETVLIGPLAFKTQVLLEKNTSVWLSFWDNLKLPLLQDLALRPLSNPKKLLEIAGQLITYEGQLVCPKAQLALILLIKFDRVCSDISLNLTFYREKDYWPRHQSTDYNEELLFEGDQIAVSWFKGLSDCYAVFLEKIEKITGAKELVTWILSQRMNLGSLYYGRKASKEQAQSIWKALRSLLPIDDGDLVDLLRPNVTVQQFEFLYNLISDQMNENQAAIMLDLLEVVVKRKDFLWDFSSKYEAVFKACGEILNQTSAPYHEAKKIVRKFITFHEGWKPDEDFDTTSKESFILCCVIFLLEHPGDREGEISTSQYVEDLYKCIINQSRFAVQKRDSYILPLTYLLAFSNNVQGLDSAALELNLIRELDDLSDLLEILNNSNILPGSASKLLLEKRVEIELPLIRGQLERRGLKSEADWLALVADSLLTNIRQ